LHDQLLQDRCPPLPFRLTTAGWQVRGTP
jgi:hypothetical protein